MEENVTMMEQAAEKSAKDSHPKKKKSHPHAKNRLAALVGALILLFAVVGFATTIILATNWVTSMVENQPEKDKFADFIYPLVMQDPPAFEDVTKLQQSTVLAAAAWNFVLNADTSQYEKDEFGFMTVPQSDLEVYATMLFGEGLTFDHQSIGDSQFSFTYNEEDGTYNIADSSMFTYVPRVTEIQTIEGKIHLRVEYLTPNMRLNHFDQDKQEAVKIMKYILEEGQDGGYKVAAIETILSGNAALSSPDSSDPASSTES